MSLYTKKIAILISGSGTNLQAIMDNCSNRNINARIALVISNKKEAYGLKRAEKSGIEIRVINDNKKLLQVLLDKKIDLVVLAGYLKILPEYIISHFENKIINIHPSLIPSFCGLGYYGRKVHEAVFNKGVKFTGATTHFVNKDADQGPIIGQEIVKIEEDYDVDKISEKVLEKEHQLLVRSVKDFCNDKLYVKDNKVYKRK